MSILNLGLENNIPVNNDDDGFDIKKTPQSMRVEDEFLILYSKLRNEIIQIINRNMNNEYQLITSNLHCLELGQKIFIKNSNAFNGYHMVKLILNEKSFVIEFLNKNDEYVGNKGIIFNEKFIIKKINTDREDSIQNHEIHQIGRPLCNYLTTPESRMGMYL